MAYSRIMCVDIGLSFREAEPQSPRMRVIDMESMTNCSIGKHSLQPCDMSNRNIALENTSFRLYQISYELLSCRFVQVSFQFWQIWKPDFKASKRGLLEGFCMIILAVRMQGEMGLQLVERRIYTDLN